jgi:hypothetical protein
MPKKAQEPKLEEKLTIKINKPPVLFKQTQIEIKKLGELMGCPIITYFKPPTGSIWSQDLYAFLELLKNVGKTKKLALFIRSNGGQGMVSLRIINLLRSFTDELILLAPSECASAATMLALGCDKIYMGPLSSLSPVDSSLTHQLSPTDRHGNSVPVSLDELWRVLKLWKEADRKEFDPSKEIFSQEDKSLKNQSKKEIQEPDKGEQKERIQENPYKYLYEYINPLVFGAVDRYSSLSVRICKEILSYHVKDDQKINKITKILNYDYPAHGYPITKLEAKKIGLPIQELTDEMLESLNKLQLLYSEMTEEKITDYDNITYHDHTIYSSLETNNLQLNYQQDYDKFYREGEKRYIVLNDKSGWHKLTNSKKSKQGYQSSRIHLQ